jgi:hypothetical protein
MSNAHDPSPDEKNEVIRSRYIELLAPLFFPEDPTSHDIIRLFASFLRVVGIEDKGWDPYLESRAILDDLYALAKLDLPEDRFSNPNLTGWRLALLFYNHIVEMDAPYEVLANLLRFRLRKGYSPNPWYAFLTEGEKRRFRRSGLFPPQKIRILKRLTAEAGLKKTGAIFDEFYRADLRNAISHSDFIFTDDGFRCRRGNGLSAFEISFGDLDDLLTKAKVFIGTFFGLEREARRVWGTHAGSAIPYDPVYKGLMEVLVDPDGLMNGFKVHWPNRSESVYRRTEAGIDMMNCFLDIENATVQLFVGSYARSPGPFSPLVETGTEPVYTPLEGSGIIPTWPASEPASNNA